MSFRAVDKTAVAMWWQFMARNLSEAEALRLSASLGLDSPKIRAWAVAAVSLPPAGLEALGDGSLDLENAARMARWDAESVRAILGVFQQLTPSRQKKKQWLDLLEDVGRREKLRPAEILQNPEMREILEMEGQKGVVEEAARHALWRRRHPELAELAARRRGQIKALALPKNLRLEADPTFEDLQFSLSLTFANHEELKALAQKVSQLAIDANMEALLKEGSL